MQGEINVMEFEIARETIQLNRVLRLCDLRLLCEDFIQLLVGSNRGGEAVAEPADILDRPGDFGSVFHKSS